LIVRTRSTETMRSRTASICGTMAVLTLRKTIADGRAG